MTNEEILNQAFKEGLNTIEPTRGIWTISLEEFSQGSVSCSSFIHIKLLPLKPCLGKIIGLQLIIEIYYFFLFTERCKRKCDIKNSA